MFEEKLNSMYSEIVGQICSMIPCEYKNIHFLGRISDGGGSVCFYFNTEENEDEYIYSLHIPKKFNVSKKTFNELDDELFELTRKLRNIFIENDQEPWCSVTMHYDNDGKFQLEYSYIDWFEEGYLDIDVMSYFKYKYLNIKPDSESYLKKMKKMEQLESEQS